MRRRLTALRRGGNAEAFDASQRGDYLAASRSALLRLRHGPLMRLRDFFSAYAIKLNLEGTTKDDILKELIGLLGLDEKSQSMLYKMLKRRENLGSTGIGRGIAIPHCRSLVVTRLRVAFGRKPDGIDFKAIDNRPVYNFFVIVAPPLEVSNQYLPVLGKIAQFAKEADVPERLATLRSPDEFLRLLEEKNV